MNLPLNIKPQFPIEETTVFSTIKEELKYGPTNHRKKWASGVKKRLFSLTYKYMTKKEMQLMVTFFNSVEGMSIPFSWTHPETSVVYTVRLGEKNIQFNEVGEDAFSCDLKLIEVL